MKIKHTILLFILTACSLQAQNTRNLVILHTNDTHSRIEAIPDNAPVNPGTAGVEARSGYINQVRKENKNVLLFDAGDFVQGTPYFNLFKGEVEIESLNKMGYDAGTIGNHEFDNGLEGLAAIVRKAKFPLVNCNYDFTNTPLKGMIKPYVVLNKFGMRIGVLGVGIDPQGLVHQDNYKGVVFMPIINSVNKYAEILKNKEKCDLIICLSHIGYVSKGGATNDPQLAQQSKFIDVIIGGHTHTYMETPEVYKNLEGKDVLVYQMGKNGSYVGRIDVLMEEKQAAKK